MSGYYYLMAQLPGILPGLPAPITYDAFREIASRFLSDKDLDVLDALSLEPPRSPCPTGNRLLDAWFARERALRLALARARAIKMKKDMELPFEEELLIAGEIHLAQVAKTAVSLDNPLEAEYFLDRERLAAIDELKSNHYFDSDAVCAYGLMLLLHERSDRFTADAGRASYTTIYNQILGEAE